MTFPLRPLRDNLIAQRYEIPAKIGTLILPSTQDNPNIVKIVALGEACPTTLKVNDLVLIEKYSGTTFKYNNEEYLCLKDKEVVGQFLEEEMQKEKVGR